MAGKFLVNLTVGADFPDRATVALLVANAAVAAGQETAIFLTIEGVRLGMQGFADNIAVPGFAPLKELMDKYAEGGGKIWVCPPCFKVRELNEADLLPNAIIAGGAKVVEFIGQGAGSVSY